MSKNILIDTTNNIETRIAVTEDGKLDDFEIEPNKKNAVKGDIYLAKVKRIEPSLQAAFVDFGTNRNGFLPLTEIHPDYFKIPAADEKKIKELNEKINKNDEDEEINNPDIGSELEDLEENNIENKGAEEDVNEDKIISIKNLVKQIASLSKKSLANLAVATKDRIGKDDTYNLSSSKLRKKLIWKDKVHLEEGLNRTLSWINKNYKSLKKEKHYYTHRK